MKHKISKLAVIALFCFIVNISLSAASLNQSIIPADSQWVIHFDMDQFSTTEFKKMLLDNTPFAEFNKVREEFINEIHFNPLTDLKGVTIFGNKKHIEDIVFCVNGTFKQSAIIKKIKQVKGHSKRKYGKHTIYNWGMKNYGVFANKSMALFSHCDEALEIVLDLMAGKGKSIASTPLSSYLKLIPEHAFGLAAANDISEMAPHGKPGMILGKTGVATFMALEKNKNLSLTALLKTGSAKNAENMTNIIKGLMALANMHLHSDKAKDKHGLFDLIKAVEISREGATIKMNFTYPSEKLVKIIKDHHFDRHLRHIEYHKHYRHHDKEKH